MFKCEHGKKISASTLILSTAKSSTKIADRSFGIRLETKLDNGRSDSAYLDFDESEEFSQAITFIHEAAQRLATQKRDETEATFSTKDMIQVGFYQTTAQEQQAFARLGRTGDFTFFSISSLPSFKTLVEAARAHLIKRGAGSSEPDLVEHQD